MSKKKQLRRIENKLDYILTILGADAVEIQSIGGGGVKPPKDDDPIGD